MPFPPPQLSTIKSQYFLGWLESECEDDKTSENYEFYFDKRNNQTLYETYIKAKSPKEVNIPSTMRQPLDELAAAKKWSSMNSGLKAARTEIGKLLQANTVKKFSATGLGQRVLAVVSLGLENPKAKLALGLFQLYTKPRTEADRWEAYLALQKLASKSKVDAALKELGLPAAVKPLVVTSKSKGSKSQQPVVDARVEKAVKALEARTLQNLKYYESALKKIKADPPKDDLERERVFESARLRHDEIHEPYVELVRRNKDFAVTYKKFVEQKKELDEAWTKVRQALT